MSIWLWALGALAPFGIGAPILFGVAGQQVGKRSWLIVAVVYGVLSWGGILLAIVSADDSTGSTLGGFMILAAWIGGAAHAFAVRGEYRRGLGDPAQRARAVIGRRREAQRLAREEPEVARQLGVGRPDVRGAHHMGVVDINHAAATALARLPVVDDELAREIVRVREEIDGFESLEDLGMVLDLDGRHVERMRRYVIVLPR